MFSIKSLAMAILPASIYARFFGKPEAVVDILRDLTPIAERLRDARVAVEERAWEIEAQVAELRDEQEACDVEVDKADDAIVSLERFFGV